MYTVLPVFATYQMEHTLMHAKLPTVVDIKQGIIGLLDVVLETILSRLKVPHHTTYW